MEIDALTMVRTSSLELFLSARRRGGDMLGRTMKSYHRKPNDEGDGGDTSRFGGSRVRKTHPAVIANGEIDELAAHVGLCLAAVDAHAPAGLADALGRVQADLFALGAMLAVGSDGTAPAAVIDQARVARLEREIAATAETLPPLTQFILSGGCELACRLHVARCVCRRAERSFVAAIDAGEPCPPEALRYLNRLSDLLFELARAANGAAGVEDRPWKK